MASWESASPFFYYRSRNCAGFWIAICFGPIMGTAITLVELPDPAELIGDLRAAGLTQQEIEARTGIAQSTISQLANGQRGGHTTARVLFGLAALHKEVCGAPRRKAQ
jgi:Helix-turn-helix